MSFFEGVDHSCEGKLWPFVQEHDGRVVVNSIQLGKYFRDQFIEVYVLFFVLVIVAKSSPANFVDLLVYCFNGLDQFAEGCLEFYARQKGKLCLRVSLLSKVRKTFCGTKDCFFLPLYCHLSNESFIVFVEFEGDIDRTDEVANGVIFKVYVEQVVPAEQGYCIVYDFLKLEWIIQLFLASPHEVNELGKLYLCDVVLVHLLQIMQPILLKSKFVDLSQLFLREYPLCFHKVTIIQLMKMESRQQPNSRLDLTYYCMISQGVLNKWQQIQVKAGSSDYILLYVGAINQDSARGVRVRQPKVREGVEAEAQRRRQVHGLRIPHPLQEAHHRPQGTHPVRSHLIHFHSYHSLPNSTCAPPHKNLRFARRWFKIQKKSVVDKQSYQLIKSQSQRHILMFNKNPIVPLRPQKPAKKEISEEVLARFQVEPVQNKQESSRRRLKKLCEVNESEEMIEPSEEEDHLIEEQQYQQFDVKDDEELKKQKEAEEKAKQNKKLKGNQDLEKFIQKQQEKVKKPKKQEKIKPQPQMSMEELMRIKKEKKQRRKSSDEFLASDKGEKSDEQVDERQLLAKRMAAYEIYNGSTNNQEELINKARQLSYTASSKKDEESEQKQVNIALPKQTFEDQKPIKEQKIVKEQPKSAKKVVEEQRPIKTGPLAGYVISTTGEFQNYDKDELIQLCEELGAQCPKSMVVRCNLLLQGSHVLDAFKRRTNQSVEETDKSKKAKEKGIKTIAFDRINSFFQEVTGKDLSSHFKKSDMPIANPVSSFLFKPIEPERQIKRPVQQYKYEKPIMSEPIRIMKTEHIKPYNPPSKPIQREQKMDIEAPKSSTTPLSAGLLWSDKYKPTKLHEVIGQSTQIKSLREWLECWQDIHLRGNKRDVKDTKGWNAGGNINSFAALLSGDPGIGKTTTARLISKEFGYAITQFNASDVRNKSGIDLMETGSFNLGRKTMEKSLIIMDEVDGMSSGDRGGITAIISMIKNTKVPIICICNDRSSEKIRSLAGHCLDVKFQPPNKALVVKRLMEILKQEGGFGEERALEQLVDTFQNDMRQILCYLEVIFKTVSRKITMDTLSRRNQSSKDIAVMINPVDAVKKLLNRSEFSRMRIQDRTDCFFVDSDKVPLMVQQNILASTRKTTMNMKELHNMVLGLKGLAIGDMLDRSMRKQQEWGLMPSYGFMTCVYAPEKMSENLGFPQFPSWLGKFSSQRKMRRLSKEFKDAILPMTNISNWKAAKESYLPLIIRQLCELLKEDKVEEAVMLIEQYNITPAMISEHLTSLYYSASTDKNPWTEVPSAVKGKLTRLYNKRHEESKIKATNKSKGVSEQPKFDPLMEEPQEFEEDEQEDENEEVEAKPKPKNKKK